MPRLDRIYTNVFSTLGVGRSRYGLSVRGVNLGDSQRFGSGSVSASGTVRYFVLPARSVFVTAEMSW